MNAPLISPEDTFTLSAAVLAIVAFGFRAEAKPWGQRLGGPLLLLLVAMVAANVGVIPHAAPVYDTIGGLLVPVAIPLLLLRADFRVIFAESGPMLLAFAVAAAATVLGAFAGVLVVDMGPQEAALAGTVTSSYIGGSLNFVATAEALGIRDSELYVAGLSADAAGAVLFLALLMTLPALRFVRARMPSRFIGPDGGPRRGAAVEGTAAPGAAPQPVFDLAGAALGLAVSLALCAAASALTAALGVESWFILVLTALALLVANLARPLVRRVACDFEIGTLLMYVFFVAIGAGADLGQVLGAALPILAFIGVMVAVHLAVLVLVGPWLKLDLAEVMIASNACILGPAPAAALAAGKGWQPLVAPGILVGVFGYAIATFIGVALAGVLGAG